MVVRGVAVIAVRVSRVGGVLVGCWVAVLAHPFTAGGRRARGRGCERRLRCISGWQVLPVHDAAAATASRIGGRSAWAVAVCACPPAFRAWCWHPELFAHRASGRTNLRPQNQNPALRRAGEVRVALDGAGVAADRLVQLHAVP